MQQVAGILVIHIRSLIGIATLSRICLLLLATLSHHLLPSYDHSTELFFPSTCSSPSDRMVISTLSPLLRWDALFFLSIARDGYQVEKQHAFYPLLPAILHRTASPLTALLNLCPSTALLLSSLLVNIVLLALSVPPLYRLTWSVTSSSSLSYLSCVLWLLCPSGVFVLSGGYTECLFACCVFWGLWLCASDNLLLSSCVLCLAAWTRSNGTLLCIFPIVRCTQQAHAQWKIGRAEQRINILIHGAIKAAICSLLIVAPSFLYSHISSLAYCTRQADLHHTPPAYCHQWLPSMYGYIQSTYWNVGPFRYWQTHQIPNFLLAAPVLSVGAAAVWWSFGQGRPMWVFGGYLFVLLCICVVVLHVQVSTRFLSSVPLLYWYLAWCWQRSEKHAIWLLSWCVIYMAVGTIVFSLFLPWT